MLAQPPLDGELVHVRFGIVEQAGLGKASIVQVIQIGPCETQVVLLPIETRPEIRVSEGLVKRNRSRVGLGQYLLPADDIVFVVLRLEQEVQVLRRIPVQHGTQGEIILLWAVLSSRGFIFDVSVILILLGHQTTAQAVCNRT